MSDEIPFTHEVKDGRLRRWLDRRRARRLSPVPEAVQAAPGRSTGMLRPRLVRGGYPSSNRLVTDLKPPPGPGSTGRRYTAPLIYVSPGDTFEVTVGKGGGATALTPAQKQVKAYHEQNPFR